MTKKGLNYTLKEQLMAAEPAQLVDIVLSLYDSNKSIQKQLDIIFAGLDKNPKKITTLIRKEIVSLKRSTRFVDYYESDSLTTRLDHLRLRIVNDLKKKSQATAFEMMIEFLDLYENTLNRVDDSNGTVGSIFIRACEDLGHIAQNMIHLTMSEIVDLVFSRFTENAYSIYDNIIFNFKNVLKDKGLDLLQEKLEETANEKNTSKIRLGLKAIADCKGDVDMFIRACSFGGKPGVHDYLDIAERLITHWRAKEALEWLDRIEIPRNHLWQNNKKELKIQALELNGEYDQAQHERLSWFNDNLSPKIYGEILKFAQPDSKETFKIDAIKQAFQFLDPHISLHFLIQIQEFEEATRFVNLRGNELKGEQYYILRPAADLLKTINPVTATHLYRKLIEPVLEETKSKYYSYAAKDLLTCHVLNSRITDWQGLQRHTDYFREIETRHKRKTAFWTKYTSILQKQSSKVEKEASNVL